MSYGNCFLCGHTLRDEFDVGPITISTPMAASKRPLQAVLEHLANCIRTKLIFGTETTVCFTCYENLTDYDNLMVKLMASQKRLSNQLQIALTQKFKYETEVFEDRLSATKFKNNSDVQLADALNPELDLKEELIEDDDESAFIEEFNGNIIELNDNRLGMESPINTNPRRPLQECIVCGKSFKSKIKLENHALEVHDVKVFRCNICGVSRKDEEYLQLHMNVHEGKTELECRYCPKQFSRPVNTLRHMRKHWDKKEFQCEKCGERFSLDNMLYNHRLIHEAEENPLICSICHQSFKSRKTYNRHQLTHQKHRPRYSCPICPKSFTERYTLKMHMGTHSNYKETKNILKTTSTVDEESFCLICGTKFQTKELLNTHLKDNHDVILK